MSSPQNIYDDPEFFAGYSRLERFGAGWTQAAGTPNAARAELLRRLDRGDEARAAYERALALVHSDAERRFLEGRLAELGR